MAQFQLPSKARGLAARFCAWPAGAASRSGASIRKGSENFRSKGGDAFFGSVRGSLFISALFTLILFVPRARTLGALDAELLKAVLERPEGEPEELRRLKPLVET